MKSPRFYLFIMCTLILGANLVIGCAEESLATIKPENSPTPDQLLTALKSASSGIKTYEATQQSVETIIGGGSSVPPEMSISAQMVIDVPNKKAFVNTSVKWTTTTSGPNQTFLIFNILYSKTDTSGQTRFSSSSTKRIRMHQILPQGFQKASGFILCSCEPEDQFPTSNRSNNICFCRLAKQQRYGPWSNITELRDIVLHIAIPPVFDWMMAVRAPCWPNQLGAQVFNRGYFQFDQTSRS